MYVRVYQSLQLAQLLAVRKDDASEPTPVYLIQVVQYLRTPPTNYRGVSSTIGREGGVDRLIGVQGLSPELREYAEHSGFSTGDVAC